MSLTAKVEGTFGSQHQPSARDFDLLRKADAGLEKQLSNLSLIRLVLIVVITFLFASAMHRRNDEAIQRIMVKIYSASQEHAVKMDPISLYLGFTPRVAMGAESLVNNLNDEYSRVFTVKFSVLGTDLSFDLRLVIVSVPLWLSLMQIYFSILREKRRLIRFVGYTFTTRAPSDEVTAIDKLQFGNDEGPYQSYPRCLIDILFWHVVVVLLGMMAWITDVRTDPVEPVLLKMGLIIVLASAFYASAFSSLVSTRLREQVEAKLGCVVPLDTFGRVWRSTNRWLSSLPARVKPRSTLIPAGLLILSTLVLPTAQVGCQRHEHEGELRPGYQLLRGNADWPPSILPILRYVGSPTENLYGRTIYACVLLLALVGIAVGGFMAFARRRAHTLIRVLCSFCALISIAFACEFANPALLYTMWKSWIWLCPLAITVVLLIVARRSPQRADKIYRSLRMGYVPLVVADIFYLGSVARSLPGLVILFFSVHLMTLGYFSARSLGDESRPKSMTRTAGAP